MPKETESGPFLILQHPLCRQASEGPLREKIFEKSLTMPEKPEMVGPFSLAGTVCYAEKQENLLGSVR